MIFSNSEVENLSDKFEQGDIVVMDLTSDYQIGTRFTARNAFLPNLRHPIKEVLAKSIEILKDGGKPLVLFSHGQACIEDWECIDFSKGRSFDI